MISYDVPMTDEQVKSVLGRVSTWPAKQQQELAELALEIEAELAGTAYHATTEELAAIDEGLADELASDDARKTQCGSNNQVTE